MSFQERQKTKSHSDQQGNHLKASVRYLVYLRLSDLQPGGVVVVTSSFSDSIVFTVHTRKTTFSNSTVFKSFHSSSGERFRTVVVWTVAVSGTKQYRFRLKTVQCGRVLSRQKSGPQIFQSPVPFARTHGNLPTLWEQ